MSGIIGKSKARGSGVISVDAPVTSVSGSTGVVADSDIDHDSLANFASNEHYTQANITTLGTVTSGTISTGAVIDDPTMTQGSDATGDVYYRAASGKLTRLATGADGTVLTSTGAGAVPAFEAVATRGLVLLEEKIISSSQSSVTMGSASLFSSTYDVYKLVISNLCLVSNQHFFAKMGIGGTLQTANYQYGVEGYDANDNQYRTYSTSGSDIALANMGLHASDDSIAEFEFTISMPNLSKNHMFRWQWILRSEDGSGYPTTGYGGARYNGTAGTLTEINIVGGANIDQGNFQLYGLLTN